MKPAKLAVFFAATLLVTTAPSYAFSRKRPPALPLHPTAQVNYCQTLLDRARFVDGTTITWPDEFNAPTGKAWGIYERRQVMAALDKIAAHNELTFFNRWLVQYFEHGLILPRMQEQIDPRFPSSSSVRRAAMSKDFLAIFDGAFSSGGNPQFDPVMHTLLHELAHFFDGIFSKDSGRYSLSQRFLEITGWNRDFSFNAAQGWSNNKLDAKTRAHQGVFNVLVRTNRLREAESLERTLRLTKGIPSFYSFKNPHEMFAEMLAAYVMDPEAKSYLHPEVQEFFSEILERGPADQL